MKLVRIFSLAFGLGSIGLVSCTTVKPYEQIYIRDAEMQMGVDEGKSMEYYVYKIREGATPAGVKKSSGGCGCN